MPMYTFECVQCGRMHDQALPLVDYKNEDAFPACPVCAAPTQRILQGNSPGFVLKGRGFHKNDYPGR